MTCPRVEPVLQPVLRDRGGGLAIVAVLCWAMTASSGLAQQSAADGAHQHRRSCDHRTPGKHPVELTLISRRVERIDQAVEAYGRVAKAWCGF